MSGATVMSNAPPDARCTANASSNSAKVAASSRTGRSAATRLMWERRLDAANRVNRRCSASISSSAASPIGRSLSASGPGSTISKRVPIAAVASRTADAWLSTASPS